MAPVLYSLKKSDTPFVLAHTGQHYSRQLSNIFFSELDLPAPDYHLILKSSSPVEECSEIMSRLGRIFNHTPGCMVVVEGDTNSVVSAAISANKCNIDVAHVEAGLRSYDLRMPEEYNRRITDHLSRLLFAPTVGAMRNLRKENCGGKIFVTGNSVIDACEMFMPRALKRSRVLNEVVLEPFVLATFHRTENVDNPQVLSNIVSAMLTVPLNFVIPLHPRTKKRLSLFGLWTKIRNARNIQLLSPVGYFDFLVLMKNCLFIMTDSGGIQEEATSPSIRKLVVVARESTERPEAVAAGFARVAGTSRSSLAKAIQRTSEDAAAPSRSVSPFGDGAAGERIASILRHSLTKHRLTD
jgi:UDP-N-acetylglucosamine 2-epimerase (non-hydrolysing)